MVQKIRDIWRSTQTLRVQRVMRRGRDKYGDTYTDRKRELRQCSAGKSDNLRLKKYKLGITDDTSDRSPCLLESERGPVGQDALRAPKAIGGPTVSLTDLFGSLVISTGCEHDPSVATLTRGPER